MRPDIVPGGTLPDYGLIDWGRPTNDDLRRDLREVTRAIRPDWDLAAPGLRERWDAATRRVLAVRAAGERADRRAGGPCSDL